MSGQIKNVYGQATLITKLNINLIFFSLDSWRWRKCISPLDRRFCIDTVCLPGMLHGFPPIIPCIKLQWLIRVGAVFTTC